jgi:hypothetical protein
VRPFHSDLLPLTVQVIEIDGTPVLGAMRDTLIVPGGGCHTVLIAFDADNPGVWVRLFFLSIFFENI